MILLRHGGRFAITLQEQQRMKAEMKRRSLLD